jgi:fructosamine-3-kinase
VESDQDVAVAGRSVRSIQQLTGGYANTAWLLTQTDGSRVVVKVSRTAPPGLFAVEAAGLDVLRQAGVRTPEVLAVGDRSLALEALNPGVPDTPEFWEAAGRATARLHATSYSAYGWESDGWLGRLPQENGWDDDGHRFFAERRLLRYLGEPLVAEALDGSDRAALERICERLPDLVPAGPPVLTHGDLWHANLIANGAGEPVFIDPAVSWMWAEVDLSMMFCTGTVPDRFFAAYHELRPPADGWRQRMPLLNLRELLCMVAHFGPGEQLGRIREILARFG